MSDNIVSLVKPSDPKAVIQRIEEMLQMAKDGEIEIWPVPGREDLELMQA